MRKSGAEAALFVMVAGGAVCALAMAMAGTSGCSSSSSDGGGGTDSGGHDTTTGDSPATMDAPPGNDGSSNDGSSTDGSSNDGSATDVASNDASDGGLPDGFIGVLGSLPVTQQVDAIASNNTTGTLYAALDNGGGMTAGIAVVHIATNTVTTTIPAVALDGGPVATYPLMVADETNNLLYAVRQFSSIVDVFDTTTNAYTTTFHVGALDTACAGFGIQSHAIDGVRSRYYALCQGVTANQFEVSVIGTSGGTYTLAAGIPLTDVPAFSASLALDTTNQLLFVASKPNSGSPILVDQINTATNQEVTANQQNLGAGTVVGVAGAAGSAVLVAATNADAGADASAGAFFSLEPDVTYMMSPPVAVMPCPNDPAHYVVLSQSPQSPTMLTLSSMEVSLTEGVAPTVLSQDTISSDNPLGGPLDVGSVYCSEVEVGALFTREVDCTLIGHEYSPDESSSMPFTMELDVAGLCP